MRIHFEGNTYPPSTNYEVDTAEAISEAIYIAAHKSAKDHGDTSFGDLTPMILRKRRSVGGNDP